MYFAMNRFRVAAGQEEAFEAVWKARELFSLGDAGLHRIPSAARRQRAGGRLHALHFEIGLGEQGRLHRLDKVRQFPRGAPKRRRKQGNVSRSAEVRGLYRRRGCLISGLLRFFYRRTAVSPLPHLCACHRDEEAPRLRRGECFFSPRTWSGWIPVTSTEIGPLSPSRENPTLCFANVQVQPSARS